MGLNDKSTKDPISDIERILLESGQVEEGAKLKYDCYKDDYLIPINIDFAGMMDCPFRPDDRNKYAPIKKSGIRCLIDYAIKFGVRKNAEITVPVWIAAGCYGEDALASYTNHLSDIDFYAYVGKAKLRLEESYNSKSLKDNPSWKLTLDLDCTLFRDG